MIRSITIDPQHVRAREHCIAVVENGELVMVWFKLVGWVGQRLRFERVGYHVRAYQ